MKNYIIAIIVLLIIFLFITAILFLFFIGEEKEPYCGDNVCESGENYFSCPQDCKKISQGIKGSVVLYQGNCMPPTGSECLVTNVSTTVKIYELIVREEIVEGYYLGEETPIVITLSNLQGYYEAALPNGHYSILVEDPTNNKNYCNLFDDTYACPITIDNDFIEFDIKIDHAVW